MPTDHNRLTIGQLSARSNVNIETIRYYERIELMPAPARSEALQRAMLTLMADTMRPTNWMPAAHSAAWAPFVVVGEGARWE